MAYYHTCPDCGASLDPGEACDCNKNNEEETFNANDTEKNKHPEFQRV